ncbi:helix-turn-helix transcriptional regulator [Saccharibacillus sacchari]|uniref:Helix-turn-helix transcriptional regulator n=1 Tax=Saccharibacillus sacchari TaxID=456493 RepID=A0ACC6P9F8_9BACL
MNTTSPQQSLGDFLRAARERVSPEEIGLPVHGRRRTPGLRREEVAQLANIGVSWYTSIEQGKDVRPSRQIIESLASALRLSEGERRYLLLLFEAGEAVESEAYRRISSGLKKSVFALQPHPAYVLDRYWDMLVWNRSAEVLFHLPSDSPDLQARPNLLRYFLTDPLFRSSNPDWRERIKTMVARFRADSVRYPLDARLNETIAAFMEESELFRAHWPDHEVRMVTDCHKEWNDADLGAVEFEHVSLQVAEQPDLKLMIYTADGDTLRKIEQQLKNTPNRLSSAEGECL